MSLELIADLADPVIQQIDEAVTKIPHGVVSKLRGAKILVTGGTGFLGSWLTDIFLKLDDRYGLEIQLTLLTRDERALARRRPDWLSNPALAVTEGDVRDFSPPVDRLTHIIHAATDVSLLIASQLDLSAAIVEGSRHVLEIASRTGVQRYLYFSSGAALGQLTLAKPCPEETYCQLRPDEPTAYGQAKWYAEHLHLLAAAEYGIEMIIARGYAFAGPRMPLDKFAFGNFVRDALQDKPPSVTTSGLAGRSYLHASDAARWLILLLLEGTPGQIFNVGSSKSITVAELAKLVATTLGSSPPTIGIGGSENYYVPDTRKIRALLPLGEDIPLTDMILQTARWAVASGSVISSGEKF